MMNWALSKAVGTISHRGRLGVNSLPEHRWCSSANLWDIANHAIVQQAAGKLGVVSRFWVSQRRVRKTRRRTDFGWRSASALRSSPCFAGGFSRRGEVTQANNSLFSSLLRSVS